MNVKGKFIQLKFTLSYPSLYRKKPTLYDQAICLPIRQSRISIEPLGQFRRDLADK